MESPILRTAPKKRLAVFLDGTWNTVVDNTNVWRMKCLCSSIGNDSLEQRAYYDIGVNRFLGGTVGKGLDENVIEAYQWLMDNYNLGDDIFIFGFSRGAYTARSLTGFIAICGLLKAGAALSIKQLFKRYKTGDTTRTAYMLVDRNDRGETADFEVEEHWMVKYCNLAPIKCVCVWDTVGFVGVPLGNIKGVSSSTFTYLHTGLRVPIQNGYHALAIDEERKAFKPTLWTVKKLPGRSIDSVEQRWFAGAHGNVGGGYESDILAQPPLRWMMKKASQHGLTFRTDVELDGSVTRGEVADSYAEFLHGWYRVRMPFRYYRPIGGEPETFEGALNHSLNESIDSSVFERYRDRDYKPKMLLAWAKQKSIDLKSIYTSVRADDPKVVVAG